MLDYLDYDEALKLWAAHKFAINLDKYEIEMVELSHDKRVDRGCDTCGDYSDCDIDVIVRFVSKTNNRDWKTKSQTLDAYHLTDLVREIVEISVEAQHARQ